MLRRLLTIFPILLLSGTTLLLFFINLSGGVDHSVVKNWYWSETDTSNIPGANFQKTRWTNYGICDGSTGKNTDCTGHSPAYPYSPKDNFHTTDDLPSSFDKHRRTYYYLSRFSYAFFLIALTFTVIAWLLTVLSFCTPSGFISSALSYVFLNISLFFTTLAACLITACHVKGRKNFNHDGHSSKIGATLFGFTWASVAMLLICSIWLCVNTGITGKSKYNRKVVSGRKNDNGKFKSRYPDSESDSEIAHNNGIYSNNEPKNSTNDGSAGIVGNDPTRSAGINFFRINRKKNVLDDSDIPAQTV